MPNTPTYPVYEKNGKTQIAATPQREVELQFDGWRLQSDGGQAAHDDTGSAGTDPSGQESRSAQTKSKSSK